MSVKLLLLYIICISLKAIDDLYTSTLEKKVNIFPQTPPLSFGLSPEEKMTEKKPMFLCPQEGFQHFLSLMT